MRISDWSSDVCSSELRLRMGIARIEGVPVAAQYWTVEDGTAFIHKLAHVEDSLKASPGTLLSAALFRRAIEVDGVKRVDFGTGNDGYKRDWMNRHDPLWRIKSEEHTSALQSLMR